MQSVSESVKDDVHRLKINLGEAGEPVRRYQLFNETQHEHVEIYFKGLKILFFIRLYINFTNDAVI